MWLPKDEREMLLKYYSCFPNTREGGEFFAFSERAYIATRNLIERKFIYNFSGTQINSEEDLAIYSNCVRVSLEGFLPPSGELGDIIFLRLTLSGLDLASKYDNWFTRSGLWFAEYKHHWLWVILAFIAGSLFHWLLGKL